MGRTLLLSNYVSKQTKTSKKQRQENQRTEATLQKEYSASSKKCRSPLYPSRHPKGKVSPSTDGKATKRVKRGSQGWRRAQGKSQGAESGNAHENWQDSHNDNGVTWEGKKNGSEKEVRTPSFENEGTSIEGAIGTRRREGGAALAAKMGDINQSCSHRPNGTSEKANPARKNQRPVG